MTDRDLEAIVADEVQAPTEIYHLDLIQVTCGDHSVPTATVTLTDPSGKRMTDSATGTGPVDAIYKSINRVLGVPNKLTEFSVRSVTEGLDAIGEVTIRIDGDGRVFTGHGANTDIIVASSHAYVNALNKMLATRERQGGVGPAQPEKIGTR